LPAEQEAIYLSTGKLPDPRQPREPSAEEIEVGRAQTLFVKEHGRPPTYDEYLGIVRGLKGRGDSENPDEAGNVVAEAINEKTAYQQQYTRNDDGTYTKAGSFAGDPKNTISAQEYQAHVDGFRTKANEKLDKLGFNWDQTGQLVPKAGAPAAAGGPPDSVVAAAKEGQYIHGPNGEVYQKKKGKAVPVKQ
jgi:hypothetical protein